MKKPLPPHLHEAAQAFEDLLRLLNPEPTPYVCPIPETAPRSAPEKSQLKPDISRPSERPGLPEFREEFNALWTALCAARSANDEKLRELVAMASSLSLRL